jgi:hypothetical protein
MRCVTRWADLTSFVARGFDSEAHPFDMSCGRGAQPAGRQLDGWLASTTAVPLSRGISTCPLHRTFVPEQPLEGADQSC